MKIQFETFKSRAHHHCILCIQHCFKAFEQNCSGAGNKRLRGSVKTVRTVISTSGTISEANIWWILTPFDAKEGVASNGVKMFGESDAMWRHFQTKHHLVNSDAIWRQRGVASNGVKMFGESDAMKAFSNNTPSGEFWRHLTPERVWRQMASKCLVTSKTPNSFIFVGAPNGTEWHRIAGFV